DVGRPAARPEPDDGRGAGRPAGARGFGPGLEQAGQGQAAEAEGPDLEEVAAGGAVTGGPGAEREEGQHGTGLKGRVGTNPGGLSDTLTITHCPGLGQEKPQLVLWPPADSRKVLAFRTDRPLSCMDSPGWLPLRPRP